MLALCCLERGNSGGGEGARLTKKKPGKALHWRELSAATAAEPYFWSTASGPTETAAVLLRSGFTVSATKKYLVFPSPPVECLWLLKLWLCPCIGIAIDLPAPLFDFLPRAAMKVVLRPRTGMKPIEVRSLGGLNQCIQRSQLNRLSRRGKSSSGLALFSFCSLHSSSVKASATIWFEIAKLLTWSSLRAFVTSSSSLSNCWAGEKNWWQKMVKTKAFVCMLANPSSILLNHKSKSLCM